VITMFWFFLFLEPASQLEKINTKRAITFYFFYSHSRKGISYVRKGSSNLSVVMLQIILETKAVEW